MGFSLSEILSVLMLCGGAIAWYADYRRREREAKKAERDELRADYDRIVAERNSYRDRCEKLEQDQDALEKERDALLTRIASLKRSLDEAMELNRKESQHAGST